MAQYSALAIFWMSFAAFIGPVFVIALICSVVKAFRTRKEFYRRAREGEGEGDNNGPLDAEIITQTTFRRKPNIKLIEDEARKKQFRSTNGSLLYANSSHCHSGPSKQRKYKDTAVDGPTTVFVEGKKGLKNKNRSSSYGSDDSDNDTASVSNRNHNNTAKGGNPHPKIHGHSTSGMNGDAFSDRDTRYSDKTTAAMLNNGGSRGRARRSSCGDGIPMSSYTTPHSNGHAISDGAYYKGMNSLYRSDIDRNGLKPNTYMNHKRRHSVQSTSPTLERIPEVKCIEVELNAPRSKSEDNLIEQNSYKTSSPYLNPGERGSDNRGFARSTETTIM